MIKMRPNTRLTRLTIVLSIVIFVSTLVAILLVVSVQAQVGNLLSNGSFDTGDTSGWTESITTSVMSGGYCPGYFARLSASDPIVGDLRQTINWPGGKMYYHVACGSSAANAKPFMVVRNSSNSAAAMAWWCQAGYWHSRTDYWNDASPGEYTMELSCLDLDGNAVHQGCDFDDVYVGPYDYTSCGSAEPTPTWTPSPLPPSPTPELEPVELEPVEPPPAPRQAQIESDDQNGGGGGDGNDVESKLVDILETECGVFPDTVEQIIAKNTPETILGWLHHVIEQGDKVDPARLLAAMLTRGKRPPKSPQPGSQLESERIQREVEWGLREPEPTPEQACDDEMYPDRRKLCDDPVPGTDMTAAVFWSKVVAGSRISASQLGWHLEGTYPIECNGSLVIAVPNKQSLEWLKSDRLRPLVSRALAYVADTIPNIEFVED